MSFDINNNFNIDKSLNDFVKINNNRLAFIYTSSIEICILIINIDEFSNIISSINDYYIEFDEFDQIEKIAGLLFSYYNNLDYLVLAVTATQEKDSTKPKCLSIFMIFGYINKIEIEESSNKIIQQNPYLIELDQPINHIFEFLNYPPSIDNNIFGYSIKKMIKFFSIPNDIKIILNGNTMEAIDNFILCFDEETNYFCDIYADNEYQFDLRIVLNEDINEYNQFCYIRYKYLIKIDMNSNSEYNPFPDIQEYPDFQECFKSENVICSGLENTLEIKLCHDFCQTCYEFSIDNNDQKCVSCLPDYQYDYFDYSGRAYENPSNCVPVWNYYDTEEKILTECNTYEFCHFFAYNGKEICFKKNDINQCPSQYECSNIIDGSACFQSETTSIIVDPPNPPTTQVDLPNLPTTQVEIPNPPTTQVDLPNPPTTQVEIPNLPTTQVDLPNDSSIPAEPTWDLSLQCDYNCIGTGICNFDNFDNENDDFYRYIKSCGYIPYYNCDKPLIIKNSNGYYAQITTVENELKILKENIQSDYSVIDLGDCADLLRNQNGLNSNDDLIILKYENDNKVSNGYEKSVQYEVYLPHNNKKLDLSICSEIDIVLYVPIELSEKTQRIYDNLKKQGYNLFDKNDKFYLKFCTPYNSLNGTDVILPDRLNVYEQNKLECQNNCEYSDYSSESKYLKCQCQVTNEEKIETKNPEKITGKTVKKSFYDVLKYSNYKVLYCYNLVFRKVTIKENLGSILSNIYFIGYLIAFGILCYTKANYLKNEISKLFEDENDNNKSNSDMNNNNITIFKKNENLNKEKLEHEEKKDEKDKENNEKINENKKEELQIENSEKIDAQKNEVEETKIENKKNDNITIVKNNKIKVDNGNENKKNKNIINTRNQPILQLKDNFKLNKNL